MRRRAAGGFTLIELMIVITLISIIASIAIPSLLRARMTANEVACIGGLKAIATNQQIFRRQDHQFDYTALGLTDKRGVQEYAPRYWMMQEVDNMNLVELSLARANIAYAGSMGDPAPANGYFYVDVIQTTTDGTNYVNLDSTIRFAVYAAPAQYNLSGRNSFYIDDRGTIYQKDTGTSDLLIQMHTNPDSENFVHVD